MAEAAETRFVLVRVDASELCDTPPDGSWIRHVDALDARFRDLRSRPEPIGRIYSIGERSLRLLAWSEDVLERLGSTMRHLRSGDTHDRVLEVCVGHGDHPEMGRMWAAGCKPDEPAATRPRVILGDRRNVLGAVWPVAGMLGLIDRAAGRAFLWLRDVQRVRATEAATLVRALVSWWFLDEDSSVLHAGAVAGARGAALLVGPGGAGKSSTSVACLEAGLDFLGDDSVLCRIGTAEAFSLSACASILAHDLADHHVSLHGAPRSETGPDGKVVLDLVAVAPERVMTQAPICALVRLTHCDTPTGRIVPVARSRVMTALAPSSVFNVPTPGRETFSRVSGLVRRLPTYELHLSGNRVEAARLLAGLLQTGGIA